MIEITKIEYDKFKSMHRNISYTPEELQWLLEQTKKHIDIHARICTSCSASLGAFIQKIYGWFLNNEQIILDQFEQEKIEQFEKEKIEQFEKETLDKFEQEMLEQTENKVKNEKGKVKKSSKKSNTKSSGKKA